MKLTLASLLILGLVIFSACAKPAETPPPSTPPPATTQEEAAAPPPSAPPTTTTPEDEETPPPATITEEDVEAARQVVFAYWEAFNNYDVEGVLAFLEESYRQEREESITSEIGQMEAFHVKIGVEEEAEPVITPEGMVGIKIKLSVPMGQPDRHITYHLGKINDEWKIYLAVEE
jgi:hypothetical protein